MTRRNLSANISIRVISLEIEDGLNLLLCENL